MVVVNKYLWIFRCIFYLRNIDFDMIVRLVKFVWYLILFRKNCFYFVKVYINIMFILMFDDFLYDVFFISIEFVINDCFFCFMYML